MTRQDPVFDQFRSLVRDRTGIHLSPAKVQLIDQRLRRRVTQAGLPTTGAYLRALLDGGPGTGAELDSALELITTNTTSFFREKAHFDYLGGTIAPQLAARGRPGAPARVKLWSAAASDGAEAWSAAMTLEAARRARHALDYAILGTDLSAAMVRKATAAIYPRAELSGVPADLLERHFLPPVDPAQAGRMRVAPDLRAHVRFRQMNLMDEAYPVDRDVDVILLRNVLIYFEPPTQAAVIARLADHIAPGGWLMVGHAESMTVRHRGLEQVRPTIFRKR
jgi:chemotaxis protein methyltransferase CheR